MNKDLSEVQHSYRDDQTVNLSDPEQLYSTICSSVVEYDCFGVFLSIMQHLLVIPSADLAGKQQVSVTFFPASLFVQARSTRFWFKISGGKCAIFVVRSPARYWNALTEFFPSSLGYFTKICCSVKIISRGFSLF